MAEAGILRQPAEASLLEDREANYPYGQEAPCWRSIPWLTITGFAYLTFNSVMAIIRSQGDTSAILFVGFSYAQLVLLFVYLRRYERAPAGSISRERLKAAVWILTTLLTFFFSYKVTAVMPPAVALLIVTIYCTAAIWVSFRRASFFTNQMRSFTLRQ